MENQQKTKTSAKKVWGTIGNIFMWIFIVFSIVVTIFAFSAQSSADGIPTIAGKVMSPVLSPSMAPTINQGDIIFSTKLDDAQKQDLVVGDIITYKADLNGDGTPEVNTHRIIEVFTTDSGTITSFQTKGDNNLAEDHYTVNINDVISVFHEGKDTKIPVLGSVISFLLTPTGFLVVIVIPLILFFIFEIVMFVRKLMEVKNAGKKQITQEDEELIKQRAIEEYIRSQQKAQQEKETQQKQESQAEAQEEETQQEETSEETSEESSEESSEDSDK